MMQNRHDIVPFFEPWKIPRLGTPELASLLMASLLISSMLAPVLTESSNGDLAGGGSAIRQLIYLALFGLTLANADSRRFSRIIFIVPLSILAVLAWSIISLTWSINPGVTVRRLILTALIIYNVFLLVDQCGSTRTIHTVRLVLGLVVVASYVAVLVAPGWAIHQSATEDDPSIVGAWKGILGQKNFAGAVCAMAILFFGLGRARGHQLATWVVPVAAAYFLYRTNSKTSIALLVTSLLVAVAYYLYNPYYRILAKLSLLIFACIAVLLVNAYWDSLLAPFSREDFLTGRGQIWQFLLRYSQDHLMLGTGFGSFWNVGDVSPIGRYTNGWVSKIASGHNGFLDLLTQLGLPGLLLAFWAVLLRPFSKLLSLPIDKAAGGLAAACIWFCVWHNLTESSLFNRDEAVETFLMLGIALLGLEASRVAEPSLPAGHLTEVESVR